ncbi:DUF3416 domain-containing protein [Oscillatoria amoena NRMC-F 0135]|nr:DUF3416 domain-containing protein [Oscillatoria amoena NRMC-F 0135]
MVGNASGKSRVVIENVMPQVDDGLYPVKRTVGERIVVTADIFSDGHDHVRADVLYRKRKDKTWSTVPMIHQGNDGWSGSFFVSEKVPYVFTVRAWVDHLETWFDGIRKKIAAQINVELELKEGSILLLESPAGKKK